MSATNLNNSDFYVTGIAKWDDGRERPFGVFMPARIVCPQVHRYGPEVERDEPANDCWIHLADSAGCTIIYLSCERLKPAEIEMELERAEQHAANELAQLNFCR
jgi:hypothetical protein